MGDLYLSCPTAPARLRDSLSWATRPAIPCWLGLTLLTARWSSPPADPPPPGPPSGLFPARPHGYSEELFCWTLFLFLFFYYTRIWSTTLGFSLFALALLGADLCCNVILMVEHVMIHASYNICVGLMGGGGRGMWYSLDSWRAQFWGGGARIGQACLRRLASSFQQLHLLVVETGCWGCGCGCTVITGMLGGFGGGVKPLGG